MSKPNCSEGEEYIRNHGLQLVLGAQVVMSIAAIFTNFIFLRKCYHKLYFHRNIKRIILASIVGNILHSICISILQSTHLALYLTAGNGCDILVSVPFCLSLRVPASLAMCAFVTLNVAMVTERFIATFRLRTYEKEKGIFGNLLWIASLFGAVVCVYASQNKTPITGSSFYCSAANKYTIDAITFFSYFLTVIEFFSIVAFSFSWRFNLGKRRKRIYMVSRSYQVAENIAVHRLLFPLMLFHFVVFSLFHIGNAIIPEVGAWTTWSINTNAAFAGVYIIPIYCLGSPLFLALTVTKQKAERLRKTHVMVAQPATGAEYYDYLSKQWA